MRQAYLLNFVRVLLGSAVGFYLPVVMLERGLDGWQVGLVTALGTATGLVASILFGLWADRTSPRLLLGLGFGLSTAWLVGLAWSPDFLAFLAFSVLGSIANRLAETAVSAAVFKQVEPARRGRTVAAYSASSTTAIALSLLGFSAAFAFLGVKGAFVAVAIAFLLLAPAARFLPATEIRPSPLIRYLRDLVRREVAIFATLVFLFTSHWGVELTVYAPFLTERFHLSKGTLGLFMAPPIFVLVLATVMAGRLLDRGVAPRYLLIAAMALNGAGSVGMSLSHHVGAGFAWRVVHEIGDGFFAIFFYGGISMFFEAQRIGGNAGSLIFVTIVASLVGSLAYAPLGSAWGNAWPNGISGVVSLVTCIAVIALYGRARASRTGRPAATPTVEAA